MWTHDSRGYAHIVRDFCLFWWSLKLQVIQMISRVCNMCRGAIVVVGCLTSIFFDRDNMFFISNSFFLSFSSVFKIFVHTSKQWQRYQSLKSIDISCFFLASILLLLLTRTNIRISCNLVDRYDIFFFQWECFFGISLKFILFGWIIPWLQFTTSHC